MDRLTFFYDGTDSGYGALERDITAQGISYTLERDGYLAAETSGEGSVRHFTFRNVLWAVLEHNVADTDGK